MKYLFTLFMVLTFTSASIYAQEPVNNTENSSKTNESNGTVVPTPQSTEKADPQKKKDETEKQKPVVKNDVEPVITPKPEEVTPTHVEPQKKAEVIKQEEPAKQPEQVQKQEEPKPAETLTPNKNRGHKVLKKDLSRRVVIRRVSPGEKSAEKRPRVLKEGYRIQIYTGGNKREDKATAQRVGEKCRKCFPQLSVYSHFISPRWTCRVGDFETFEEAKKYLLFITKAKAFPEARIVRSNVLVAK